jgi:lipoate-protein ligase A
MAIDQALLESVQAGGQAVLRLYRWRPAALSLGRNQPVRGTLDAERARVFGVHVVRRPTGGAAVYHDNELTYAVAAPVACIGSPRTAYRQINAALVAGLKQLGIGAHLSSAPRRPPGLAGTCFDEAAEGEVSVQSRKLIGSAQRYEGGCVLQHGSLLLDGSQDVVSAVLGLSAGGSRDAAELTMAELLGGTPDWNTVVSAIVCGFETTLGIRLAPDRLAARECALAGNLLTRFQSDAWTWRR